MSHFTTVKTKLKDRVCLLQALKDLDYEFTEAEQHEQVKVRGYNGELAKADICVKASKTYDVGIQVQEDGTVELFADWWGVETTRGLNEQEFINQITQRYAYHKVLKEIQARGFTIEQDDEQEDTIQLTVRKWL
jgi:hypothetical protein